MIRLRTSDATESTRREIAFDYESLARGDVIYPGFFSRDYMNFGYWEPGTSTRRDASNNLMRRIIAQFPAGLRAVLDVACGLGATTEYVRDHCVGCKVQGINISEAQLDVCRRRVPDIEFTLMDAVDLAFPCKSFSSVVCVEAAFHFDTRRDFMREASRVLEPGGILVLTDLLVHAEAQRLMPSWLPVNYVSSADEYRQIVYDSGFAGVTVTDITEAGVHSYLRFMFAQVHDDWLAGRCDYTALRRALDVLHRIGVSHRQNLMCVAVKAAA